MSNFIVIGLGNFGMHIARSLTENGTEVMGIDTDKVTVQYAKDHISHAVTGDASNKAVLESLSLEDFDGAVVSIGQEMAASILICLYLKELGVEKIVARAISEDHEKILHKLGISDVLFPERDVASRMGKSLSNKNILDYLPVTGGYSIMEIIAPGSFIGKKLLELNIGAKFHCQILGIRSGRDAESVTIMAPSGTDVIHNNSILFVLGKQDDIEKMQKA